MELASKLAAYYPSTSVTARPKIAVSHKLLPLMGLMVDFKIKDAAFHGKG